MSQWLRRRIVQLSSVLSGLKAEEVALIAAVGFICGTLPIYGVPTFLCAGAALLLRINLPALQIVNQLVTPVQLALILPMVRVGAAVIGARSGVAGALVHAMAGWLCLCVPVGIALYFGLACALRCGAGPWPARDQTPL